MKWEITLDFLSGVLMDTVRVRERSEGVPEEDEKLEDDELNLWLAVPEEKPVPDDLPDPLAKPPEEPENLDSPDPSPDSIEL